MAGIVRFDAHHLDYTTLFATFVPIRRFNDLLFVANSKYCLCALCAESKRAGDDFQWMLAPHEFETFECSSKAISVLCRGGVPPGNYIRRIGPFLTMTIHSTAIENTAIITS